VIINTGNSTRNELLWKELLLRQW